MAEQLEQPVVIKKHANRRPRNLNAGRSLILDDLGAMVEDEEDFVVYDAETGSDVTPSVLKRIIFERRRHG